MKIFARCTSRCTRRCSLQLRISTRRPYLRDSNLFRYIRIRIFILDLMGFEFIKINTEDFPRFNEIMKGIQTRSSPYKRKIVSLFYYSLFIIFWVCDISLLELYCIRGFLKRELRVSDCRERLGLHCCWGRSFVSSPCEFTWEYIRELVYRRLGRGSCGNEGISGTRGACVRFT